MTHDPVPGSYGLPLVAPVSQLLEFKRGWVAYFRSRRELTGSAVFKTHLGVKAITLLDPKTIPVVFDTSRVLKRYGIGPFVPPPGLVGEMTPTMFLNGDDHILQKQFWMALIQTRRGELAPVFDRVADRYLSRWSEQDVFSLDDQLNTFWAEVLFQWLIGADGPTSDLQAWLPNIFAKIRFGSKYRGAQAAHGRLLQHVQAAPGFAQVVDLASEHGMNRDLAAKNLVFSLGFNAWAGLVGLTRSGIAELTLHPDATSPMDHFVLEVSRLHPPVNLMYAEARDDLVIESGGKSYGVAAGELLMAVSYFAHRDPSAYTDPDAFRPSRFQDVACRKNLIWAGGPDTATPGPDNKMCPGRDVVLLLVKMLLERLRPYQMKLAVEPEWSLTQYPIAGGPTVPLDMTSFRKNA